VARGLVSVGRRLPVTCLLAFVLGTLQVATLLRPDMYDRLQSTYTYNWQDLASQWQLYRAVTAIFIKSGPGLRLGILSMLPLFAA
jgi:membrane associated rhomboid family serine protease